MVFRLLNIIFFLSELLSCCSAFASSEVARSKEVYAKAVYLSEFNANLDKYCQDKSGHFTADHEIEPGVTCATAAVKYNNELDATQAEISRLESQLKANTKSSAEKKLLQNSCATNEYGKFKDPTMLNLQMQKVQKEIGNKCKKDSSNESCFSGVMCNVIGLQNAISFIPDSMAKVLGEGGVKQYAQALTKKLRSDGTASENGSSCSGGRSSCAEQAMLAILKAVWSSLSLTGMVWDLAKKAPSAAIDGAKSAYHGIKDGSLGGWIFDFLHDNDNKISLLMNVASQLSPSQLGEKTAGIFASLTSSISNHIKENYACEKFKAPPNQLECEIPLTSWDCASCRQRLNTFCGIAGALVGQVPSMLLMGGELGLAKVGFESAKKLTATIRKKAIGTKVSEKAADKLVDGVNTTSTAVTKLREMPIELKDSAKNTQIYKHSAKALSALNTKKNDAFSAIAKTKIAKNKAAIATYKVVTGSTNAVIGSTKRYVEMLDKSFSLGYRTPLNAYGKTEATKITTTSTVADLAQMNRDKSTNIAYQIEYHLKYNSGQGMSAEAKAQIKKLMDEQLETSYKILKSEGVDATIKDGYIFIKANNKSPFNEYVMNKASTQKAGYFDSKGSFHAAESLKSKDGLYFRPGSEILEKYLSENAGKPIAEDIHLLLGRSRESEDIQKHIKDIEDIREGNIVLVPTEKNIVLEKTKKVTNHSSAQPHKNDILRTDDVVSFFSTKSVHAGTSKKVKVLADYEEKAKVVLKPMEESFAGIDKVADDPKAIHDFMKQSFEKISTNERLEILKEAEMILKNGGVKVVKEKYRGLDGFKIEGSEEIFIPGFDVFKKAATEEYQKSLSKFVKINDSLEELTGLRLKKTDVTGESRFIGMDEIRSKALGNNMASKAQYELSRKRTGDEALKEAAARAKKRIGRSAFVTNTSTATKDSTSAEIGGLSSGK